MRGILSKLKLDSWPNIVLAISTAAFIILLSAYVLTKDFGGLATCFFGLIIFGLAAQEAHYKKTVKRNDKKHGGSKESKWRLHWWSSLVAVIGILITVYGFLLVLPDLPVPVIFS